MTAKNIREKTTIYGILQELIRHGIHGEVTINIKLKVFFRLFVHCKTLADVVLKKKQQEIILIFLIEKFSKLNNFIHHHNMTRFSKNIKIIFHIKKGVFRILLFNILTNFNNF